MSDEVTQDVGEEVASQSPLDELTSKIGEILDAQPEATEKPEAEEVATTTEPEVPETTEQEPWLTEEWKSVASQVGISEQEALDLGSPKALATVIRKLASTQQPVAPETKVEQQAQDDKPFNWREALPEEEREDLAPQLEKVLDVMSEKLNSLLSENKTLSQKLKPVEEFEQRRVADESRKRDLEFDEQLSKLGDAFVPLFGKGTHEQFADELAGKKPASQALKNRITLFNTVNDLKRMKPGADPAFLLEKALSIAFDEQYRKHYNNKQTEAIKKQATRKIGKSEVMGGSVAAKRKIGVPLTQDESYLHEIEVLLGK